MVTSLENHAVFYPHVTKKQGSVVLTLSLAGSVTISFLTGAKCVSNSKPLTLILLVVVTIVVISKLVGVSEQTYHYI